MALKVVFEIGHYASLKTKRPHEIFTHDWEVFVRGADNADVSHFVDKVVFQLHDTFPRPKRVVKEPPYSVKESGYAGFNLPIEIHLKNREEPKKIRFNYDLHLQQSGPTISRLQKEKYVFQNPSEEFRRKLLKGGAAPTNAHPAQDHDRNGADPFGEDRTTQLIGKPKLGGDAKKHKPKEHRPEMTQFTNLFGPPIHKTSRISPDPKKPSPNPKADKKDKDRARSDRDRPKAKRDSKERDHREERKPSKDEKEKSREEKKQKSHKERDQSKDKIFKRAPERPPSPAPPAKRPTVHPSRSPPRVPSPSGKSNGSASGKEDIRQIKQPDGRLTKISEVNASKEDKKSKKDRKPHDKDRESKKERKEKDGRANNAEIRDGKSSKEVPIREIPAVKEKPIPSARPDRPINKFSIENMLKDPTDTSKYGDNSKQKDLERKHKHKKKDKKRDESREKSKDALLKDKKHKHKQKEKAVEVKETFNTPEKVEPVKEAEKINLQIKNFKEKERNPYTISPIPLDTSSQSSSKSGSRVLKTNKPNHSSSLSSTSDSDTDQSVLSESEDASLTSETSKNARLSAKNTSSELNKSEQTKSTFNVEASKSERDRINVTPNHKLPKNKEKATIKDVKEEKKQRKRKSGSKGDDSENLNKVSKISEDSELVSKVKRSDLPKNAQDGSLKSRPETSSRSKSDTKVQDDGVSSSLSDNPVKCDSPVIEEESHVHEPTEISPDYMMQLQELQRRIMTIQSNDELERVVNLIAETGKYEVTKKTFDFDLCLLDRTTVQQLQELIGCESRA